MTSTYIGNSVHADIHTLRFAPGDATKLWVGCDGGVFRSTNPTGTGDIFTARNTGLQTLTMEYLGQHPTEDAVLFAGTQDNGGERFTGEEAWLYSSGGDAGFAIVNWNDPYRVLSSYVYGSIRRSTDGGTRYSYANVDAPMMDANGNPTEGCQFYAPIAGTPPNLASPTAAADANLVAFGSIRPWISTTFGGGWQSIPNNALGQDSLDGNIRSLVFASPTRLYAGTVAGGVYRFDKPGANWTRTQIDTIGGANALPLGGPITDIAVDPANASRVYVTFGGTGDYRHVWFFDGAQWQQRSGPAAGNPNSLLDVQANAIVVDPAANPAHLYVGADIGVWRSTDGGANWATFSEGLPDAGVTDLVLHDPRRLLRAATHGRGVYEHTMPDTPKQGVELYVRSTQLDRGRSSAVNDLPDPTAQGQLVKFWRGPDIKLDTPDASGQYQFPLTGTIDFLSFVDMLTDDFQNVATHATATITTRVYVQVHNHGVLPADNVRVMLLLANASAGLPPLPAGFDVNVRNGLPINTAAWRTVGFATLTDVRVGFPKIAAFDLTSNLLPPPANLAGHQHHCVLALIHHPDDQFTNAEMNVGPLSRDDRKAAHKNLTVVQFTGALPPPAPAVMPVRMHNPSRKEALLTNLILSLNAYPGRVRAAVPICCARGASGVPEAGAAPGGGEMLVLELLGGFVARLDPGGDVDLPVRKAQALLAFLALSAGQAHLREKLAALLWGDLPTAQARANLRHTLFTLRKALAGVDALRLDRDAVTLDAALVDVDVAVFERRLAEATPDALAETVALYRGDLLAGMSLQEPPFEEWLAAERERLRELALEGLARLLGQQRAAGKLEPAVQTALRLLGLDPLQEAAHRTLMRLYMSLGRRGPALRQYHVCVAVLERELHVDPETETKELYQEILRRRPTSHPTDAPVGTGYPDPAPPVLTSERPAGDPPLVGRERELATLRRSLDAAWGGRPQLVAVIGEGGVGKTRLVTELAASALARDGVVLLGRAYETERVLPFGSWIDAFRASRLDQDADIVGSLAPVHRAALARLLPGVQSASALGAPDYLELFEGITRVMEALAARQPHLFLLEDVHWADEMSVRLLAFLGRRVQRGRLLVVVTVRAEELPAASLLQHTLDELRRTWPLEVLELAPLSRADTARLATQLAPSGRVVVEVTDLEEKIWLASRGNAFIIVETLRALASAGGEAADLPLPDGVRELVVRRLEGLGDASQRLVTAAAVIGREFDFGLVHRISGLGEEQAAEAVEELVRRRLLRGVGEQFELPHDRIRHVVYDGLLPPRRALLHRRVAEALEALHPADVTLGTHYLSAGVWDKAADHLERAGTSAAADTAHGDAARCYEQALTAVGRLPETTASQTRRCELLSRLGYSLATSGAVERALPRHEAAVSLAETLGDPLRLCSALGGHASALTSMGRYAEGLASAERALGVAASTSDLGAQFWIRISLARIHHARGNYRTSIEHARLGAGCLDEASTRDDSRGPRPDVPPAGVQRSWVVLSAAMLGAFEEGVAEGAEMLASDVPEARTHGRLWALASLGTLHVTRGDVARAVSLLEPALVLCRRIEMWALFPRVAAWLGSAYTLAGRLDEATAILDEAVARARSLSFTYVLPEIQRRQGEAYRATGRLAAAEEILSGALALARTRGELGSQTDLLRTLGDLARDRDAPDLEAAAARYRDALVLADRLGMRPTAARCLFGLGHVLRRQGRPAKAELGRAVEQFRDLGMALWLPQAEEELARAG